MLFNQKIFKTKMYYKEPYVNMYSLRCQNLFSNFKATVYNIFAAILSFNYYGHPVDSMTNVSTIKKKR